MCETEGAAINSNNNKESCIWIESETRKECKTTKTTCESIGNDKEMCETKGVVFNKIANETIKCFYSVDGRCYNRGKECESFSNESCIRHTNFLCIPTAEGCK
jgi:hypothetical protein